MRLIYKGKILKDELTIEDFKIGDGQTIHLVKGKTNAAAGGATADVGASSSDASANPSASSSGAAGLGAGGAGANPFANISGGFGGM